MLSRGNHTRLLAALGALTALLAGLLAFGPVSPAFAHDSLIGSDPADGAVVEALPDELALTFSGVLLTGEGATEIVVTDAAGSDLTTGEPVVDGVRVRQPLTGTASGSVQVAWRVVSSDGHPISGEFAFSVGDPSDAPPSEAPSEAPDDAGSAAGDGLLPVWIGLGVLVVIAAVIGLLVGRRRPSHED